MKQKQENGIVMLYNALLQLLHSKHRKISEFFLSLLAKQITFTSTEHEMKRPVHTLYPGTIHLPLDTNCSVRASISGLAATTSSWDMEGELVISPSLPRL